MGSVMQPPLAGTCAALGVGTAWTSAGATRTIGASSPTATAVAGAGAARSTPDDTSAAPPATASSVTQASTIHARVRPERRGSAMFSSILPAWRPARGALFGREPDGLDVDKFVDAEPVQLAPVARASHTAEGKARIRVGHPVDEHPAGVEPVGEGHG